MTSIDDPFYGFILFSERYNPEKVADETDIFKNTWTGAFNQISSIIAGIFNMKCNDRHIGILDNFITCVYDGTHTKISNIINLKETTINLNNIKIFTDLILL